MIQKQSNVLELWIARGKKSIRKEEVLQLARKRQIPVKIKKMAEFSSLFPQFSHQGFAVVTDTYPYLDLHILIEKSLEKEDHALLVVADHITDEGNMGALIRTSAFFGAHGLIIPKDRSASISPKVMKRSSGAYTQLPVSRVVNLKRALDWLKKREFWIIGAGGVSNDSIYGFDWQRNLVLILGNEQRGLSRPVKNSCHQLVGIPSSGPVESLNVGVAAGAILSEILRQRTENPA